MEGAVETVRPLIEQRRHELTVSLPTEPIWLNADTARLEQVLANLLSNAAKYTEQGGQVVLTIQQVGDECVMCVRDTGVGISPTLLPRIFDLFTQADRSLDRSQGGLGIGLALVQRLTELHDGKVEATSVVGQGSEFTVRLPVWKDEGEKRGDGSRTDSSDSSVTLIPASLKVLVVDDNVDTVLSFSMLLRASGHDVQTAHDGPTGVQMALDYQPDVVLLDIGLPGLTGLKDDGHKTLALKSGFDSFLVKPVALAEIKAVLDGIAPAVARPVPSSKPKLTDEGRGTERRLPIEEARRIRSSRPSKTLTQAESEAAICDGIIRFQEEFLGWRAEQIRVHLIKDFLLVRIHGALTLAERQLGKSSSPENGRDLIKQTRKNLLEMARPMLESLIHEAAGVKVLSMHHDLSTVTGEEVVLFSLAEPPRFQ